MAKVGITKALAGYFNSGDGVSVVGNIPAKRSLPVFRDELKALSDVEKRELALMVCAVTGDTLE